jgi:GTP pyrophosphokinase
VNLTSKTQIDRLGDRLRKGKFGDEELRRLDEFRLSFAGAYQEVVTAVRKATKLEPTGRPAMSTTSIVEKLRRETIRLTQMQDIAGCRLVGQDIFAQDLLVEQLRGALPIASVTDRRKHPSHGYRAVHVIATARGKPVEIQVRTGLHHLWAQLSEKLSDVFDPAVKYGGGDHGFQVVMSKASENIANLEALEVRFGGPEEMQKGVPDLEQWKLAAEGVARLKQQYRFTLQATIAKLEGTLEEHTGGKDDFSN